MALRDTEVFRIISGRRERAIVPAFSICIADPQMSVDCIIGNETEAVHIFLRPELLHEVANELFDLDVNGLSFSDVFGRKSASISWFVRSIKQLLTVSPNLSRLEIDSMSRDLCADILSKFAVKSEALRSELTDKHLLRIDDYAIEHLGRDIQIDELASLCAMGRTTFYQRFKSTMDMTPHQHIIRLRVSKAKQLLASSSLPLMDIGFVCGFADQAHFANLFKRYVGMTPAAFRRAAA
jgi:AraC family transcriptional regulator